MLTLTWELIAMACMNTEHWIRYRSCSPTDKSKSPLALNPRPCVAREPHQPQSHGHVISVSKACSSCTSIGHRVASTAYLLRPSARLRNEELAYNGFRHAKGPTAWLSACTLHKSFQAAHQEFCASKKLETTSAHGVQRRCCGR